MRTWAIVVAAGSGKRFGGLKQFAALNDVERVVDRSISVAASVVEKVVCVTPPEFDLFHPSIEVRSVPGGSTRADSVRAGLSVVPRDVDIIVVHDAARPAAPPELFHAVINEIEAGYDAAIPAMPVHDTVKKITALDDGHSYVDQTIDREGLVLVQTPQAFRASVLREAHESGDVATDDAALVEAMGGKVIVIPGKRSNIKLTSTRDLEYLSYMLRSQ